METIDQYEKYADCVVVCPLSQTEYPMLRQLLIIKSDYFKALFSEQWNQLTLTTNTLPKLISPISLSDKIGWPNVRNYLLMGSLNIKDDEIVSALQLSMVLVIYNLSSHLQKKLSDNLPLLLNKLSVSDLNAIYEMNLLSFDDMVFCYQLSFFNGDFNALNDDLLTKIHYRLYLRKISKHFYPRDQIKYLWPLFSAEIRSPQTIVSPGLKHLNPLKLLLL
jgi:hypothetical protein